ncbi:MAG: GH25 family lysozyme [Ginsengibacter sp.]
MARKKKRKSFSNSFLKILLWLVIAVVAVYYAVSYFISPPDIFYPGFQIDIPPGYAIHGIDVSRYQDIINWKSVKEMKEKNIRIGFVFIKATEGISKIDPQFRRNWLKAEEQEIPKGAYHFFIASKSGKKQAANFIQMVDLKRGDLPPVLDIEKTYGVRVDVIKKELADWLEAIEKNYGVVPVIYTNIDFYKNYLEKDFAEYPVWIAHYLQPNKPRLEHKWIFWQHSEAGRVNGITSPVDFNVFSGDSTEFNTFLIR